eukprot:Blabericola_migrator_1__4166@NODE_2274_length_3020_cov_422_052828_g1431_i0_p2_GENE_NODE_2274_length_3020_cov_422_052828_g1431_i0NODE_2274_length_3020_cov_422_052828_g1431_i0_p2_ORF_typecomplete_len255_score40_56Hydrolase_3/PF08282_12/2_2e22Hydrolase_6/PF13344_6/0_0029DUF2608/PF11019_8/0_73HAD_2/PF13419_6/0_34_NODE_2274_length_3020_cov_422_052828_g1431_i02641028
MLSGHPPKPTWVATDMDGTFLDPHHTVSSATREAYKRLTDNGVPVIPCTGRSLASTKAILQKNCPDFLSQLKLTPGVYINGNVVYGDTEEDVIYNHIMPMATVKAFLKAYYQFMGDGPPSCTVYANGVLPAVIDYDTAFWRWYDERYVEESPRVLNRSLLEEIEVNPAFSCCMLTVLGDAETLKRCRDGLEQNKDVMDLLKAHNVKMMNSLPYVMSAMATSELNRGCVFDVCVSDVSACVAQRQCPQPRVRSMG